MEEALAEFLRYLALEKNASAHTVKSYREDLMQALDFFRDRLKGQALRPDHLTNRLLRAYLAWLHERGLPALLGHDVTRQHAWDRAVAGGSVVRASRAGREDERHKDRKPEQR